MSFKFTSNSEEVSIQLDIATEFALRGIGTRVVSDIKKASPVDTGKLRRSIDHQVDQDSVKIGTNNKYASFIELGTSKREANPFITNTVNEDHGAIVKIIEKSIRSLSKK